LLAKLSSKSLHFFFKYFVILFNLYRANIAARSKNKIILFDFVDRCYLDETCDVFVILVLFFLNCRTFRDTGDVIVGELFITTANHFTHFSRINKECFIATICTITGDKP